MRRSLSLIALVASLAAAQSLPAQKRRFVQKPKLPAVLDATQIQDEVVIKFHEGSGVRLRGGRFVSLNGTADTSKAMEIVGSRKLGRFFTRAEKDLDREREEIRALLQDGEEMPAELNLYFVVKTSGKADSENLINALNEDAPSV